MSPGFKAQLGGGLLERGSFGDVVVGCDFESLEVSLIIGNLMLF